MENTTEKRSRKRPLAAAVRILGTLLLILVLAACIPLTVPRFFGCQIYSVVSGSMEPSIPVGSLVYIKAVAPEDVQEGDVAAFYGAAVLLHLLANVLEWEPGRKAAEARDDRR